MNITIIDRNRFEAELENVVSAHAPNPITPPIPQSTGLFTPNGLNFPADQNWPTILVNMTIPGLNLKLVQNFMAKFHEGTIQLTSNPVTYGGLEAIGYAAVDSYTERALLRTVGLCCPPSYLQTSDPLSFPISLPVPWYDQPSMLLFINSLQKACEKNFTPAINLIPHIPQFAACTTMEDICDLTGALVAAVI